MDMKRKARQMLQTCTLLFYRKTPEDENQKKVEEAHSSNNIETATHMAHLSNLENAAHLAHLSNLENAAHMAHMSNIETAAHNMSHPSNVETTAHTAHSSNIETAAHTAHTSNNNAAANMAHSSNNISAHMPHPSNIDTAAHMAHPSNIDTAAHMAHPSNIDTAAHMAHPSNIETGAEMDNIQHLSVPKSIGAESHIVVERAHTGGGWLLSGIICVNTLILGCALVTGSAFNSVAITAVHRQIFLIILLLLTTFWMLFYTAFTFRKNEATHDPHAGPVWLRVGLVLFGLLSLMMDIFKIAYYVGYLHCDSGVKVAFPVIQVVFLFVQTYFLWVHAKDCVQLHSNFTRCGLTLTISTNLVLWMAAVTEELIHQTEIPDKGNGTDDYLRASYGDDKCTCSHSACKVFKAAYYYLYPFNIEYSLFASAMAYVMWKNVGRYVDDHVVHKVKFRVKNVYLVGPVTGILLVVAGLAAFIVYEVYVLKDDEEWINDALSIYFIMNIVIVSLMSVSMVLGCTIYRIDHREHISEKNPSRTLDVGLLIGASLGQFIISYFTIVAVVATGAEGYLNGLNLACALLTVIELGLQNYFIIEGLHREPFYVIQEALLHTNAQACQCSVVPEDEESPPATLTWKRRVLKEVCTFVLLGNIILWIMPAFGARPQFDHYLETKFYKFTMWAAIVNIGLPFGIFYRMHSISSLFEVYMGV